jgi:hypothetical protein
VQRPLAKGDDGIWRFRCHSCGAKGDIFDVMALRTGRPLAEILRQNAQDAPESKNAVRPYPRYRATSVRRFYGVLGAFSAILGGRAIGYEALKEFYGQNIRLQRLEHKDIM